MKPLQDLAPVYPEFITSAELTAMLSFETSASAYKWIARHGLRRYWRSARRYLVRRADVVRVLEGPQ